MARPKDIGTQCETAVVNYLQSVGFSDAERRSLKGNKDCGDITGIPGLVIEVKGGNAAETASDNQIESWLDETELEGRNAGAQWALLVVKRKGVGLGRAGDWWSIERIPTIAGPKTFYTYLKNHMHMLRVLRNPEVEE